MNIFWKKNIIKDFLSSKYSKDFFLQYQDRKKNNILHIAVWGKQKLAVEKLLLSPSLCTHKNLWEMTPYQLAIYLKNDDIISLFKKAKKKVFQVEREQEVLTLTQKEFEDLFEITYFPNIAFEKPSYLETICKKCLKARKTQKIDSKMFWQGFLYEQDIIDGVMPNVVIKWIDPVLGCGLFTTSDIMPNTYVGSYTGMVRKYDRRRDIHNPYCFEYVIGYDESTKFLIDAKEQGNEVRFINHSATPNLIATPIYSGGVMHICLFSNQQIPTGTQLTYSYGEGYWKKRESPR